ncbi:MAG: UDP-N-acetylmuramate--L-alanine ligase [Propionibacteriaceae bacterium]|nr:UDP-N-acetylmuramate--L-alanine ligase [Propionibacteriaceae bacterium]
MLLSPIEVEPALEVGPVHFIAAGGAGMSGIARLYVELGVKVTGSDQSDSRALRELERSGATVYVGHDASQIADDVRTVVISTAVREGNVELVEARRRGLRVWHRSAALAALMLGRTGVAITGTHGKTTTTAMTAVMLSEAGADPSYVIGSPLVTTGVSSAIGSGDAFVVEADESDGSFLQYPTKIVVITNVEADHLDNWGTPAAYAEGFYTIATQPLVETVILGTDDEGARALAERLRAEGRSVVTYGEAPDADVRISDVRPTPSGSVATITDGEESGSLHLQVPGSHNLANAAASYAVGRALGLSHAGAVEALERFVGTLRRFQLVANTAGIRIYDDYAHHPTEIRAALSAARRATDAGNEATGLDGRLIACFQPHLFSRTMDFCDEFGASLTAADVVVVNDIEPIREDPIPGVTGEIIVDAAKRHGARDVRFVKDKQELPDVLNQIATPGDLIVTLGAGDVTLVGPLLAQLLEQREQS